MDRDPIDAAELRSIHLRPAAADDESFLLEAFVRDRAAEFAPLRLGDAELDGLLRMQYEAQTRSYRSEFPDSARHLILLSDRPIGRLWIVRRPDEIRVLDILVVPEFRGRGIGTLLLGRLLAEAGGAGRPVRLRVARTNAAAIRLYARLGFEAIEDAGPHLRMEWTPAP